MILYFAYLLVLVEKAGKVDQKKKSKSGAFLGHVATQQTYRRYCAWYHTILWRDDHPEGKKRTVAEVVTVVSDLRNGSSQSAQPTVFAHS